jgi:hypothetical protein
MIEKIKEFIHYGVNGKRIEQGLIRENQYVVDDLLFQKQVLDDTNKYLIKDLIEIQAKYEISKQQINDLLKKETINILELKSWYENRRRPYPWMYNGNRLGFVNVVKYLEVNDIQPFSELANEIIERYKLDFETTSTEIITAMYRYWNLRSNWTYVSDQAQYGRAEWWESPNDALIKRRGDCESKAKCMYWTGVEMLRLLNMSEHDWRLTFWATSVLGEGGHALLSWLGDDGEYYAVESTYDENNSKYKTWLRTPIRFNNLYGTPWGFATKDKSWSGSNEALLSFRDPETNI